MALGIRTAGWAVAAKINGQLQVVAKGLVPGRQTVDRAELCALVWATRCQGIEELIIDAKYLQKGMDMLTGGKKEGDPGWP